MRLLQTDAPAIFSVFGRCFYYDAFSIVHTNTICMRFRFVPLSEERFQIDALSVWTEGLNARK